MIPRKILALALLTILMYSADLNAQVKKAVVGVDGFTCSLCAKGVERQLQSLNFVKSVKANLRDASFTLEFSDGKMINLNQLNRAVTDGGFTLRSVEIQATGFLNADSPSVISLSTGNTPVLIIEDFSGAFNTGDNVSITGNLDTRTNTVKIKTIKKL